MVPGYAPDSDTKWNQKAAEKSLGGRVTWAIKLHSPLGTGRRRTFPTLKMGAQFYVALGSGCESTKSLLRFPMSSLLPSSKFPTADTESGVELLNSDLHVSNVQLMILQNVSDGQSGHQLCPCGILN